MNMSPKFLVLSLGLALSVPSFAAPEEVSAFLEGHAILPVNSTVAAPSDAPSDMKISGKYTTGKRIEKLAAVPGKSADRLTGISLPIENQPRQGHSGIKHMDDGTFWVISDNGFGNKINSYDSMLYLNQYQIDFKDGSVKPLKSIFLHDPDRKVPFHITNESTEKRYLSGHDFDPESFQFAGGFLWVGDEFGPFLIKADMNGKILEVFDTKVDGKIVRSPENPYIQLQGAPDGKAPFEVTRSKGFEGMASSPDGTKLYPLLEGALWDGSQYENIDGKRYLRILEFDTQKGEWTGRHWKFVLDENHHAIGDFNMIDDEHGLIIERDNGEGTADKACKTGEPTAKCFSDIAKFKRIYRIEMNNENVGKEAYKQAYIDLLNIQDPKNVSRVGLNDGVFKFPFFTIEDVDVVDANHIVVGNDNNFPGSSSRDPNKADDNEFILLKVEGLL